MDLTPDSTIVAYNPSDVAVDVAGTMFQAHQRKYVSFLWMRNHYGDPRSIQDMPRIIKLPNQEPLSVLPRQTELQRVNTIWMIGTNDRGWDYIPKIEFYDDNEGRIVTVYDDPSGLQSTPANQSLATVETQARRIDELERTLDELVKQSGLGPEALPIDLQSPSVTPSDADIPTDDSTAERTTSPWADAVPEIMLDDVVVNE